MLSAIANCIGYIRSIFSRKHIAQLTQENDKLIHLFRHLQQDESFCPFIQLSEHADKAKSSLTEYRAAKAHLENMNFITDGLFGNRARYSAAMSRLRFAAEKVDETVAKLRVIATTQLEMLSNTIDMSKVVFYGRGGKPLPATDAEAQRVFFKLIEIMPTHSPARAYFQAKVQLDAYQTQKAQQEFGRDDVKVDPQLLEDAKENIQLAFASQSFSWDQVEQRYCDALYALRYDKKVDATPRTRALRPYAIECLRALANDGYMPAYYHVLEQEHEEQMIRFSKDGIGDAADVSNFKMHLLLAQAGHAPSMVTIIGNLVNYVYGYGGRQRQGNWLHDQLSQRDVFAMALSISAKAVYYKLPGAEEAMQRLNERSKECEASIKQAEWKNQSALVDKQGAPLTEEELGTLQFQKRWLHYYAQFNVRYIKERSKYLMEIKFDDEVCDVVRPASLKQSLYERCTRFFERLCELLHIRSVHQQNEMKHAKVSVGHAGSSASSVRMVDSRFRQ